MNPVELSFLAVKPRKHRRRRQDASSPPTPAALVLVAAYYDGDAPGVYVTFDRAVDASAVVLSAFVVDDAPESIYFIGSSGPSVISETQILIFLSNVGASSGPDVLLTVGAGNGIVAVDDGGTWAGVSGLVLPFG